MLTEVQIIRLEAQAGCLQLEMGCSSYRERIEIIRIDWAVGCFHAGEEAKILVKELNQSVVVHLSIHLGAIVLCLKPLV